jgi:hypothetical protein
MAGQYRDVKKGYDGYFPQDWLQPKVVLHPALSKISPKASFSFFIIKRTMVCLSVADENRSPKGPEFSSLLK